MRQVRRASRPVGPWAVRGINLSESKNAEVRFKEVSPKNIATMHEQICRKENR